MKSQHAKEYDVIVIGGGASGMMAAGTAAANGQRVLLLEKNPVLGKKLKITGGGRCNITNATFDNREFLSKYNEYEKFLYSPLSQFNVQSTFDFFESRGLPLVIQARNRVFPVTERAEDVYRVMRQYITSENIDIMKGTPVYEIHTNPEKTSIRRINTKAGNFEAKKYIIATGGSSHPETGSTGDAFGWLKNIGHTINSPSPSIVPLRVNNPWVKELAGTSLSFMKISFYVDGKKNFHKIGKVLFTHFGLSGPLILNCAHLVADLLHEGEVTASIDCYPDTEMNILEEKIIKVFNKNKNRDFKNITKEITPVGLSETILNLPGGPKSDTKVHSITKEERKVLVHSLKGLPLTVAGLMGMDRAVISDGGVPLDEIDTKTMKSKLYDNLYITGDMLHVNRPSGGYSLQLAWTTGYVAGKLK